MIEPTPVPPKGEVGVPGPDPKGEPPKGDAPNGEARLDPVDAEQ